MEEIDLREVAKTVWSKKIQIIVIVAVFAIIGGIYTYNFVTPKYTAKTTLILASINGMASNNNDSINADTTAIDKDISLNSKLVSTYSELIKSKNILRRVISNLDIDIDEEALKKSITVDTVEDTELIRISVENTNNELACYIANEIANVFKEQIKVYYDIENVQIVDVAEIENNPSNVHHKRDIAIFGLIGMVVSAGYVLILNMLDTTVKSMEDLEEITKLPVLASLPTLDNLERQPLRSVGTRSLVSRTTVTRSSGTRSTTTRSSETRSSGTRSTKTRSSELNTNTKKKGGNKHE